MLKIKQRCDNIYMVERGRRVTLVEECLSPENKFNHSCFAEERKIYMFNFVEQPVAVRDYDYALLNKRPTPMMVQGGIQPVELFQEDIRTLEHPQSLLGSVFSFRKRKG